MSKIHSTSVAVDHRITTQSKGKNRWKNELGMYPVLCISKEVSGGTKVPSLQEGFPASDCSVRAVALPGNRRWASLAKIEADLL